MSKPKQTRTFEVLVTACRTVLVDVEDTGQPDEEARDDALEQAREECTSSAWEIDQLTIESECKTEADKQRARKFGAVNLDDW